MLCNNRHLFYHAKRILCLEKNAASRCYTSGLYTLNEHVLRKKERAVRYIYTVKDWMGGVWRGCVKYRVTEDEVTRTWRDWGKTLGRDESTVPMNLTRTARLGVVWIHERQVRDWWNTLVNTAMNLFLTSKVINSLTIPTNPTDYSATGLPPLCLLLFTFSRPLTYNTHPETSTTATHMKRRARGEEGNTGNYAGVI